MKKKNLKIKGPPGFESGTSFSAVESSLIKNVSKSHYLGFNLVYRLKWAMSGLSTIRSMTKPYAGRNMTRFTCNVICAVPPCSNCHSKLEFILIVI